MSLEVSLWRAQTKEHRVQQGYHHSQAVGDAIRCFYSSPASDDHRHELGFMSHHYNQCEFAPFCSSLDVSFIKNTPVTVPLAHRAQQRSTVFAIHVPRRRGHHGGQDVAFPSRPINKITSIE
jgi:hypothetical protein